MPLVCGPIGALHYQWYIFQYAGRPHPQPYHEEDHTVLHTYKTHKIYHVHIFLWNLGIIENK